MRQILTAGALLLTVACGSSPSSPTAAPAASTPVVFSGTVAAFGESMVNLSLSRGGQMTLRVTWSDPTVDIDVHLLPSNCNSAYAAGCGALASSNASTGTSETILFTVRASDFYKVSIDNLNRTKPQPWTLSFTVQ